MPTKAKVALVQMTSVNDTARNFETCKAHITDAKSHRLRLESIRKVAGVFGVMGAGLTSDSYGDLSRGREGGFKAQLKSFYGLQSGAGFEDVLSEK